MHRLCMLLAVFTIALVLAVPGTAHAVTPPGPVTVAYLSPISPSDPAVIVGMHVQLLALPQADSVGLLLTEYRLDGGAWQPYSSPFELWDAGTHTLEYRSTDALGVVGAIGMSSFEIMLPIPTVEVSLQGDLVGSVYESPVDVFLWVDDNGGWPVLQTEASTDGVNWFPTYTNFTVWEDGPHTYWFRAITWNGPVSEPVRVDFTIRFPRPDSQAFVIGDAIADGVYLAPALVAFNYRPGFFHIRSIEWRLAGETEWRTWDIYAGDDPLLFDQAGDYAIEYRAVDEMGYAQDATSIRFSVITPRPESTVRLEGVRIGDTEYASPVTAEFFSWAEYVPVARVEWKLESDAEWTVWDGSPVTFDRDGDYALLYRAVDVLGGTEDAHREEFSIRMLPPITEATLDREPGEAGWFTGPVRVTLSVVDPGTLPWLRTEFSVDGGEWTEYLGPFSVAATGVSTVRYRTVSQIGAGEEPRALEIRIDDQAPDVRMDYPREIAAPLLLNAVTPVVSWSAFDAQSGVGSEWSSIERGLPLDTTLVGERGLTVTVADRAGNRWEHVFPYRVVYGFAGFLPPLDADGSSAYRVGSTVPVKFRLFDAGSRPVGSAVARFSARLIPSGTRATSAGALPVDSAIEGGEFVYDSKRDEYRYNWGTRGVPRGTYEVSALLDDGTTHVVNVSLK